MGATGVFKVTLTRTLYVRAVDVLDACDVGERHVSDECTPWETEADEILTPDEGDLHTSLGSDVLDSLPWGDDNEDKTIRQVIQERLGPDRQLVTRPDR